METTRYTVMRRFRRRLLLMAGVLLVLILSAELISRFYFGLGDPPLSVADPEIEYLFKPNQTYERFGNIIHYNAYSMRSDDFPPAKASAAELRVMVFGDSVINGGTLTDQSQLATSIVQQRLREKLNRPVVVGNISAGSWGPVNQLAYARKYGFFDADHVVIVVSSHDVTDLPTYEPLVGVDPNFPATRPWSAAWEALTRYVPRLFASSEPQSPTAPPSEADARRSLQALAELVRLAREAGAEVAIVQHLTQGELADGPESGHAAIAATARANGIEPVQLDEAFRESIRQGQAPYRDSVHPSESGQRVIAGVLYELLYERLRQ